MAGFLCPRQWPTGLSPTTASLAHSGRPGPRPYGSAPHGAAANRPSVADSASPIAPTKNTKEPAEWRVFCVRANGQRDSHQRLRRWLTRAVLALALTGPRLTARLRIGRPWPIRRVQSRLPRTLKNPPDGGFFCVRANGQRDSHQRLRRWFTRAVLALALTGPRLTARLRIGLPWPIRRVPSRPWRPVCGVRLRCFYYCRARGRPRRVAKNA